MNLRSEFDLDPSLVYLNSGTHSLCPKPVFAAVLQHLKTYERNPTEGLFHACAKLWEVQQALGKFFDADPKDMILRENITQLMNLFILGTDMPKDSEILLSSAEYGAVENIIRFRCERDKLKMRKTVLPSSPEAYKTMNSTDLAKQIIGDIRPETKMLVLSHVITGNGLVLPIAQIAQETRARGVTLIVDGAHSPGGIPLKMSELQDIDYYGGNLHKWMMGPKGTSFGWVPKRNQSKLHAQAAGWTSFELNPPFNRFADGESFPNRFLTMGCLDYSPFFALKEMLEFWQKHSFKKISERIGELQDCVESEMKRALPDWPPLTPAKGALRGPLLSFKLPSSFSNHGFGLATDIYQKHRIQIATPTLCNQTVLRISPHIYNTEDEIKKCVGVLKEHYGSAR